MSLDKADSFLRIILRSQRGRLKVYLGYSAGVGKTYQMLQEGHRLREQGIDVVIGLLETHGRADIARLAEGLEVVPRRRQEYRGIAAEEMDVDAVLARKPQVALIDELAHTNLPGSRNAKRYEDVQDILAAGIHVITTVNIQHLESLFNTVEQAVGVKVRERMPDSVLAEADQIVDVDVSTEDLRTRIQDGKVYPRERIETALANFFTTSNLEKLRELAFRELASQIDLRRREAAPDEFAAAPDQVMVCLSSHGPNSERLLRFASRLAGKLNRNWYAVYVKTRADEARVMDAQDQRFLSDALTLAKQLGAIVFTYTGEDVADTILKFAQEYRVGHIVVGRPNPRPFWKRFGRNRTIVTDLVKNARNVNVIVVDTSAEPPSPEPKPEPPRPAPATQVSGPAAPAPTPGGAGPVGSARPVIPRLGDILASERIVLWEAPATKEEILDRLVEAARRGNPSLDADGLRRTIGEREAQGSTFLNEGAAFPHARIERLPAPIVSLGVTKRGVSDVSTERQVDVVFLILTPAETPDAQVHLLGLASRAAQNRHLVQALEAASSPEEALRVLRDRESPPAPAGG